MENVPSAANAPTGGVQDQCCPGDGLDGLEGSKFNLAKNGSSSQAKVASWPWSAAKRLVKPNAAHTSMEIVEESLKMLEEIREPVRVVSLVGTQREGKSTLLNLISSKERDSSNGFRCGHAMDPETTGLWMRVRDHPRQANLKVLVIDSEGLDSPHVPQFYNWCLSALTLLISDVFMYQSRGNIDARNVDRLDIILRVAEQLLQNRRQKTRTGNDGKQGGKGVGEEGEVHKPTFLWLLRDHHLKMSQIPRDEMIDKLSEQAHRSLIRCFSSDFDCFPLPNPAPSSHQLSTLDQMKFEEYCQSFREEYVVLERKIFSSLLAKRKLKELTGNDIANLIRAYCNAIGNRVGTLSQIDDLPTQAQMLAQLAAERAIRAGLETYDAKMSKNVTNVKELATLHEEAILSAKETFFQIALGSPEEKENQNALDKLLNQLAKWEKVVKLSPQNAFLQERQLVGGKLYFCFERLLDERVNEATQELNGLENRQNAGENVIYELEKYTEQDFPPKIQARAKKMIRNLVNQSSMRLVELSKEQETRIQNLQVENENLKQVLQNQAGSIEEMKAMFASAMQLQQTTIEQNQQYTESSLNDVKKVFMSRLERSHAQVDEHFKEFDCKFSDLERKLETTEKRYQEHRSQNDSLDEKFAIKAKQLEDAGMEMLRSHSRLIADKMIDQQESISNSLRTVRENTCENAQMLKEQLGHISSLGEKIETLKAGQKLSQSEIEKLEVLLKKKEKEIVALWDAASNISCAVTEIHARLDDMT